MELALPSQILITFVYWAVLHRFVVEELEKQGNDDIIIYLIFVFVHIQPFITILVQIYVTKIKFINSHGIYFIPLGIVYLSVNFFGTKYYGEPFYPFLTWEDYKSPVLGISLFMICYKTFGFFCDKVN